VFIGEKFFEMNFPAASGRGIRESILFAASGGEFTQKRLNGLADLFF